MENGNQVISIKNLSIGYSEKIVLENISIDIDQNDVVAILGLNGTGKSTLLRTMSGLQPSIKGEIFINGKSLTKYSATDVSKQIGIVLSGRAEVMPLLTVVEILSLARTPYTDIFHKLSDEDKVLIENTLSELNIIHLKNRKIYQLSDGEAQKVFIAKAIVQQTSIILMDEPTSHLDIHNKIEIFSLIKQLGKQNKTIVFASHELDLAIQVADKCFLIDKDGTFVFGKMDSLIQGDKFALFFDSASFKFNKHTGKFETRFFT